MKDEQLRKHLPRMFSLIKNESWGLEDSGVARMHAGRDDFTRQLDAYGIYHETHTFADAPHVFPLLEPWFPAVLDYTVAFLRRVLPAPAR